MNLYIARTTLLSKPSKHLIEVTAYEVLAMVLAGTLLLMFL